jgi:hypothetical protein
MLELMATAGEPLEGDFAISVGFVKSPVVNWTENAAFVSTGEPWSCTTPASKETVYVVDSAKRATRGESELIEMDMPLTSTSLLGTVIVVAADVETPIDAIGGWNVIYPSPTLMFSLNSILSKLSFLAFWLLFVQV